MGLKFFFMVCLAAMTGVGCNTGGEKHTAGEHSGMAHMADGSDRGDKTTIKNGVNWPGTYSGNLPCADCDSLVTEIMLHKGDTYMMAVKIAGKNKIRTTNDNGAFSWIDDSTIKLQDLQNLPAYYKVQQGKLTQLDMKGISITGADAAKYDLLKK